MKKWLENVKANKGTITKNVYSWAGEQFVKTAIVVGVTWAAVTIMSGWLEPNEIKEALEQAD